MVSSPSLSSFLSQLRLTHPRNSSARVYSDTLSPCQAFEADLAANLQKLLDGDNSSSDLISFSWMCKALDVVISTQAAAKQALQAHISSLGLAQSGKLEMSKMMEQYMEDSVRMLDVCHLLKEALGGVNAYVKASHLALKRLQGLKVLHQVHIQRAKYALLSARNMHLQGAAVRPNVMNGKSTKGLSACSSMLRRMGHKLMAKAPLDPLINLQEPASTASMAFSTLYAGKICTLFFLRLLSTSLSAPASVCSRKSASLLTPLHLSGQAVAWTPFLMAVEAQLNSKLAQRRTQRCITLFSELHMLEASMNRIYEALLEEQKANDLMQLVDSTSILIQQVQSCMARLEHQIEIVFSSIVATRTAMLD